MVFYDFLLRELVCLLFAELDTYKQVIFSIFKHHEQRFICSAKKNIFQTDDVLVLQFAKKLMKSKQIRVEVSSTVISRHAVREIPSPSFVFLNFFIATERLGAFFGVALYTIP